MTDRTPAESLVSIRHALDRERKKIIEYKRNVRLLERAEKTTLARIARANGIANAHY